MSSAQNGPDQLPLLGKMVLQKLDELRQLDQRIEKRLARLETADANLRVLLDSLRNSILEAHPLIGRMNELRQASAEWLTEQVEQARQRTADDARENQTAAVDLAPIEQAIAAGVARIDASATMAESELQTSCGDVRHLIERAETVAQTAGGFVAELQSGVAEARPILDQLSACKTALDDRSSIVQAQLDEAIAAFTMQADATIAAVRRNVAQQIEQLAAQTRLDVRPILSRVVEQQHAAETQVATATEQAEAALARRADELKRNAERMLDLCEQQLVDRIATIRPRTRAAVEAIEQAANQRVTASMDDMQKTIERAEFQAIERLEALRPRFAEMMLQLERDIREQSKRMEDDAIAGAHWLEHRLSARMEEVSARVSRLLRNELEQLDRQSDSTPRARPSSPVQVQVMVDALRSNTGESVSAA